MNRLEEPEFNFWVKQFLVKYLRTGGLNTQKKKKKSDYLFFIMSQPKKKKKYLSIHKLKESIT